MTDTAIWATSDVPQIDQAILAAAAAPILAVHILIYVRHRRGRP